MLLAKLKFAILGLFTVAVVSTSVGVLAQQVPDRSSDNDRLKAVERKLDKLLEVLGGSSRHTPAPDAPPSPAGVPQIADLRPATTPAIAPMPPVPPAPPVAPSADTIPAPGHGDFAPPRALPTPKIGRADLAGRVELLDRRISELERRFNELERRINFSQNMPGMPGGPGLHPTRGPGAGVHTAPAQPPVGAGPFNAPDTTASGLTAPGSALPSVDPAFPVSPPQDATAPSPASPDTRPGIN